MTMTPDNKTFSVQKSGCGILILAAGRGARFTRSGGAGNKLLAKIPAAEGQAVRVIEQTLRQAKNSQLPVAIVTRAEYQEVIACAEQADVAVILCQSQGSGDSIAAGVAQTLHWAGWLIVPGDMPWITAADYQRVADELDAGAAQARLMHLNQPGHPVGFSTVYRHLLLDLNGDDGAKSLLDADRLVSIAADENIIRDVDFAGDAPG